VSTARPLSWENHEKKRKGKKGGGGDRCQLQFLHGAQGFSWKKGEEPGRKKKGSRGTASVLLFVGGTRKRRKHNRRGRKDGRRVINFSPCAMTENHSYHGKKKRKLGKGKTHTLVAKGCTTNILGRGKIMRKKKGGKDRLGAPRFTDV